MLGLIMRLIDVVNTIDKSLGISEDRFIAFKLVKEKLDPFEFLIGVILSQNTSDKNAIKAFSKLKKLCGYREITPSLILKMPRDSVINAIKVAGLYERRYEVIINLAKVLNGVNYREFLTKENPRTLRVFLMRLKGLGPKTVDVFLLMYRGFPVFPIDTHIRRVLRRMGFVASSDYFVIQEFGHRELPKELYLKAHLLLIEFGRRVCKARKPLCNECPFKYECPKLI